VPEMISRRQFAARIRKSEAWVRRLISEGSIPVDASGRLNAAAAFEAWEALRGTATPPPAASTPRPPSADPDDSSPPPDGAFLSIADVNAAFGRAKLRDKQAQARLRELRFEEARGLLVKRSDVDADSANVGALIRTTLLGLPGKLAPQLSGRVLQTEDVGRLLEAEIDAVLQLLYESRYRTPGG